MMAIRHSHTSTATSDAPVNHLVFFNILRQRPNTYCVSSGAIPVPDVLHQDPPWPIQALRAREATRLRLNFFRFSNSAQ